MLGWLAGSAQRFGAGEGARACGRLAHLIVVGLERSYGQVDPSELASVPLWDPRATEPVDAWGALGGLLHGHPPKTQADARALVALGLALPHEDWKLVALTPLGAALARWLEEKRK